MLDKDKEAALNKYKTYMEEEESVQYSKMNAVGDEAYKILCESKKKVQERKRLDEILIEACADMEEYKQIKAGSRKRALTKCKLQF